jgi:hypothetical protein
VPQGTLLLHGRRQEGSGNSSQGRRRLTPRSKGEGRAQPGPDDMSSDSYPVAWARAAFEINDSPMPLRVLSS